MSVAVKARSAWALVFSSVALAALLSACGQRGPLYMPDRTAAASKAAPASSPAAAAASSP